MHSIQIPDDQYAKLDDQYAKLTEKAQAAGYGDVTAFMKALAGELDTDPRGPRSDDELRQSAAECDRINAEMKSGKGHDALEALRELGG